MVTVLLIELAKNVNCGVWLVTDRGGAPSEAATHGFEHQQLAALDASVAHGGVERQRHGGGRCVGMLIHRHDDLVFGKPQLARGGIKDAGIGLMWDDPVDVLRGQASGIEHFAQHSRQIDDSMAEDFRPLHADMADGSGRGRATIHIEQFIVAAIGIIWAASHRIFDPQPIEQVGLGLALSVISSVLNGVLAWVMFGAAKAHRSIALEADAKHLVTDVWTSVGVVIGIGLVSLTGWLWLDALVAIAVALNILKEGVHLIWRSSQGLMDEAVEPETIAKINETLAGFAYQRDEVSIIRFDHITTRQAGQRLFVDLHMHMPASWSLGRAAALRSSVEQALMSSVPGLRASIQLLPSDVEAHFDSERDLL